MSPPPTAALALLGIWVLMVFFVTNETGYAQLLSEGDDAISAPESGSDPATDEGNVAARASDDGRDSSDGVLDSVSDAGPDQESESPSAIRSPADD